MIKQTPWLLCVVAVFFGLGPALWGAGLAIGDPAPEFALPDLSSQPVSLSQLLPHGPVLLSFFASWCPGCNKEYPILLDLARDPELASFSLVGIDLREPPEAVAGFVASWGQAFPLVLDRDGFVTTKVYKIRSIPALVLIDSAGAVRYIGGALGHDELKTRMLELCVGASSTLPAWMYRQDQRRRFDFLHDRFDLMQ